MGAKCAGRNRSSSSHDLGPHGHAMPGLHWCAGRNRNRISTGSCDFGPHSDALPGLHCPVRGKPGLTLEVVSARGLRRGDWVPGSGKSGCYCIVKCRGEDLHQTKVIHNCLEPRWRETVEVTEWDEGQSLEFHILAEEPESLELLGKATLESQSFAAQGFNNEVKVAECIDGVLWLKIKVPGKDFPPGPLTEFEIEVERDCAESWGAEIDVNDPRMLFIDSIKAGPFERYNQHALLAKKLTKNEFIKSVNGVEGSTEAMMIELKESCKVKLVVIRASEMTVSLDLSDTSKPVGMVYPKIKKGHTLVILDILEKSIVHDYNSGQAEEELKIKPGDRMLAVNGARAGVAYLKNHLRRQRAHIQLTLLRPR